MAFDGICVHGCLPRMLACLLRILLSEGFAFVATVFLESVLVDKLLIVHVKSSLQAMSHDMHTIGVMILA